MEELWEACRVCETYSCEEGFSSILSVNVLEKFQILTGIDVDVDKNAGRAVVICGSCLRSLDEFWNFRSKAMRAQNHFDKLRYINDLKDRKQQQQPSSSTAQSSDVEVTIELPKIEADASLDHIIESAPIIEPTQSPKKTATKRKASFEFAPEPLSSSSADDLLLPIDSFETEANPARSKRVKCKECPKVFASQEEYVEHVQDTHIKSLQINLKRVSARTKVQEIQPPAIKRAAKRTRKEPPIPEFVKVDVEVKSEPEWNWTENEATECEVEKPIVRRRGHRRVILKREADEVKEELLVFQPNEDGRFRCPSCPPSVSFESKKTVNDHFMLVHLEAREYPCPHCDSVFFKPSSLRTHQLTHTNQKDFLCNECDQTFARKYQLECHMRKHTDSYYHCPRSGCKAKFVRKYDLKRHGKRHINEI